MAFKHKAKKNKPTIRNPRDPSNNEDPKEIYMDLMYMVSRKRQDLMNKLGVW